MPVSSAEIEVADNLVIPWPHINPIDGPIQAADVREMWFAIIKPLSDKEVVQSVELRTLMAVVRSVYYGMHGNVVV